MQIFKIISSLSINVFSIQISVFAFDLFYYVSISACFH